MFKNFLIISAKRKYVVYRMYFSIRGCDHVVCTVAGSLCRPLRPPWQTKQRYSTVNLERLLYAEERGQARTIKDGQIHGMELQTFPSLYEL